MCGEVCLILVVLGITQVCIEKIVFVVSSCLILVSLRINLGKLYRKWVYGKLYYYGEIIEVVFFVFIDDLFDVL